MGAPAMEGMPSIREEEGLSFRPAGECLLVGGAGHRTGKNTEGGNYGRLIRQTSALYPQASVADHVVGAGLHHGGRRALHRGEYAPSTPVFCGDRVQ